jgi:hypothetical protein
MGSTIIFGTYCLRGLPSTAQDPNQVLRRSYAVAGPNVGNGKHASRSQSSRRRLPGFGRTLAYFPVFRGLSLPRVADDPGTQRAK